VDEHKTPGAVSFPDASEQRNFAEPVALRKVTGGALFGGFSGEILMYCFVGHREIGDLELGTRLCSLFSVGVRGQDRRPGARLFDTSGKGADSVGGEASCEHLNSTRYKVIKGDDAFEIRRAEVVGSEKALAIEHTDLKGCRNHPPHVLSYSSEAKSCRHHS
jgi:hypothetical protein